MATKQNSNIPAHFESLYPDTTRFTEVKSILEHVSSGRSCQVIGIPGSGKSNLLGLLSYNRNVRMRHLGENQKWFHFVYMDFSEVKKRTMLDVIKFMLISVIYSLSERGLRREYEVTNQFLKEAIGFNDELILFQALKKSIDYLAIEREFTIVFLIDRFEQYFPDLTEQFFLNLKILRNRAKYRFSCVFSLTRPLEDMLEPSVLSEFHEFLAANLVFLILYDKVGIEFRLSYLEKAAGKRKDEKTKKEIIASTGGHGKLTRLAYEAVLSHETQIEHLKDFLIERNVIRGALFEIWNYLTPSEQLLLKNVSHEKTQKEKEYLYLENVGLIKNEHITIPLFAKYLETISEEKTEHISYDPERNEILQGNKAITEKFSPSEFRLLRFLIQNQTRICEKEEIIASVWRDTKTQEGVTDQALDQIIYRLRRKIENNPNTPIHLQTIKGRGFKFIP